jgi:mRNA interferase RelE/StbE
LALGPAAASFLDGMKPSKTRARIVKKYRMLQENPYPNGCKKMESIKWVNDAVWRVRVGDYRILYVIREQEVLVIDIDHRKDVYR